MRHSHCLKHGCMAPYSGECGTFDGDRCKLFLQMIEQDAERIVDESIERRKEIIQEKQNGLHD